MLMLQVSFAGFQTAKGELVRSIMYPKPMDFKFYQDAIKFILVLGAIASAGMAFTVYIMFRWDVSICVHIILYDIVGVWSPLTFHYVIRQKRLHVIAGMPNMVGY